MTPSLSRLREIAIGGAASVAATAIATNLLRIVSGLTLSRLLDPSAYGVVGVITSVAYMISMLSDVGIYDFIVRHKEGEERDFLDQIWTLRLMRGIALAAVMIAVSGPATRFLGKPQLAPVVAVWSLNFVLDGLSSLAFATAVRHRKFWRLSNLDLCTNVGTLIMSVIIAAITHSYWSMVVGMFAGSAIKLVASYVYFPESRRRWNFSRVRSTELWGFSRYIAMSSILSLAILQSDKVVLARLMPLSVYGLYAIATTLAAAPGGLAAPYAIRVLLSVYTKTAREQPQALRRVFYQGRRKVTLLYMAGVGAMLGGAPLIVAFYPHAYHGVTPFLQLLLISAALRLANLSAKQVLIAIGRTGAQLIGNVASLLWLAVGGLIGLLHGNIMLLVAVVGTVEVPNMICFWWSLRRERLLDLRQELIGFAATGGGIALGAAASGAGLLVLRAL